MNLPAVKSGTGLALNEGPTVLGERQVRIPTIGKVRPGIKVLTPTAAKNQKAVEIYERGVNAGRSYGEIESEIMKTCNMDKSPTMPKNVPYFTVKRCDFNIPEIADTIMDRYAEDRGEGLHLYRFPVVFPVDSWQVLMPHALRTFTRSELVYWSEYGADGVRYCKTHGEVEIDQRAKRAKRPFGGRPVVLRPDNGGVCNPEKCDEYQEGRCKLSGALIFYIPGIPGASAIELPMTSFYAMNGIRQQLELMQFLRGRVSGTHEGGPLFYLTKKHEEVSMIDPKTGKAKRVRQWIIVIEADIEMTKLMAASETNLLEDASDAVLALEGPATEEENDDVWPRGEGAAPDEAITVPAETAAQEFTVEDLQVQIVNRVKGIGMTFSKHFTPYAIAKHGEQWGTDHKALSALLDELDALETDEQIAAYFETVSKTGGTATP